MDTVCKWSSLAKFGAMPGHTIICAIGCLSNLLAIRNSCLTVGVNPPAAPIHGDMYFGNDDVRTGLAALCDKRSFKAGVVQQVVAVLRLGRQTDGTSEVTWHTDPAPTTLSAGDHHRFRLPAAMGWRSQPEGRFTLLLNGEPALEFPLSIVDASWQNRDASVRMTWTVLQSNSEDGVGVLVLDVAGSHLIPGRPMELTVRGSRAGSRRWFGVLESRE